MAVALAPSIAEETGRPTHSSLLLVCAKPAFRDAAGKSRYGTLHNVNIPFELTLYCATDYCPASLSSFVFSMPT